MRIGIVLHPYGEEKPAGLARTIFELAHALVTHDCENEYILYVKKHPRIRPDIAGNNLSIEVLGGGIFWLEKLRRASRADIYIFNTPVLPLFFKPKRSIALAPDFAYCYFPDAGIKGKIMRLVTKWYHGFSLQKADRIIAMSDATKKDILRFFGRIPKEKITTCYWGYKDMSGVPREPVPISGDFFLFIGVIKERKNVFNIVRAFREYVRDGGTHALVLAGKGSGKYYGSIRHFIADEGIADRVILPGFVSEGQVAYLYKNAAALVFPSFIEGFGFPVLEAMSSGLPVITSNTSSLAEIGRDGAALLIDPSSSDDIKNAMKDVCENKILRNALIQKGYERAREFLWDTRIPAFISLLKSVEVHHD